MDLYLLEADIHTQSNNALPGKMERDIAGGEKPHRCRDSICKATLVGVERYNYSTIQTVK